jgi:hypothetical protein
VLITVVSLALILLLFFKIDWLRASAGTVAINRVVIFYFLLSALFGCAVGASEIISRYRDEPFTALTSSPYQNLTSAEKAKINDDIATCYASPELPTPLLKFMAVAFGFLNIMGEKNFRALISNLKAYQALAAAQPNGANQVWNPKPNR